MDNFENKPGIGPQTVSIQGHYHPEWSEGSLKPPIFASSTFVAQTAEELAHWFKQAYGLGMPTCTPSGLVYSRLVNPNMQIYEERCAAFENAEAAALFGSGMTAIMTTMFALLSPGDTLLFGGPIYGGTDFLFTKLLPKWGVKVESFMSGASSMEVAELIKQHNPKVVFVETPANPTLTLADVRTVSKLAHDNNPETVVIADNTVLTFVSQKVLDLGADLTILSATKMLGGHDDLIGGLLMGRKDLVQCAKDHRTIFGTGSDPNTAWMLARSLEDLKLRVEASEAQAMKVAQFLNQHKAVKQVLYPGSEQEDEQMRRWKDQCSGHGSFMSFRINGGVEEAYRVINSLKLFRLAVSLGGTVSLTSHPMTHTHSDVEPEEQQRLGITADLIRISVGLEDVDDLIKDLDQALNTIV